MAFNGNADDGIKRWPAIVAVNRFGEERKLLESDSEEQAVTNVDRVQADFDILGLRRWCEKYDVPWDFVTA